MMDGKQVAVLVPTTVLAQQHYVTFSQRLSAYPTRIEVLSRFRTDKEQREIVEALALGQIDICIGTHRLIQKDVRFKDLGLVIVDEEQRFGVGHKERMKQMRREVDVLTLTATPIPRTLHMSMAGVRDMSTMETPPRSGCLSRPMCRSSATSLSERRYCGSWTGRARSTFCIIGSTTSTTWPSTFAGSYRRRRWASLMGR